MLKSAMMLEVQTMLLRLSVVAKALEPSWLSRSAHLHCSQGLLETSAPPNPTAHPKGSKKLARKGNVWTRVCKATLACACPK
eukprot:1166248-Amphidinium_carterae.2